MRLASRTVRRLLLVGCREKRDFFSHYNADVFLEGGNDPSWDQGLSRSTALGSAISPARVLAPTQNGPRRGSRRYLQIKRACSSPADHRIDVMNTLVSCGWFARKDTPETLISNETRLRLERATLSATRSYQPAHGDCVVCHDGAGTAPGCALPLELSCVVAPCRAGSA